MQLVATATQCANNSRVLMSVWTVVFMKEEQDLREKYKTDMAAWRKKVAKEKKIEREEREVAALKAAENGPPAGMDAENMDNKWMGQGGMQTSDDQFNQDQQQRHGMAQASMLSNPYLQAAAFGGGFNPGAPYLSGNMNAFAGQGYMQGGGNPGMSLFGKCR